MPVRYGVSCPIGAIEFMKIIELEPIFVNSPDGLEDPLGTWIFGGQDPLGTWILETKILSQVDLRGPFCYGTEQKNIWVQ